MVNYDKNLKEITFNKVVHVGGPDHELGEAFVVHPSLRPVNTSGTLLL